MDSHTAREKNQVPGTEKALLKTANQWVGGRDATRCRCNATQIEIIGREIIVCKESKKSERQKTSVDVSGCNRLNSSPTMTRDKGFMGLMW